jgi:hypothetical protein
VLPTDSQQPEILESHIRNLAALFVRNHAEGILGIHLAHGHFATPENTTVLGVNYDKPYCRWARPMAIRTMDLSNVHGHIFVLTNHGFHPYEYQTGPGPDLSGVDSAFLPELADYLNTNNLSTLVGLQVIDQNPAHMLELVLPLGRLAGSSNFRMASRVYVNQMRRMAGMLTGMTFSTLVPPIQNWKLFRMSRMHL